MIGLMSYLHVILVVFIPVVFCVDNGLSLTPPMGWMQWERFRCNTDCSDPTQPCVSEQLFMNIADAMVDYGYRDSGYTYVSIDDCWMDNERNATGYLQPDKQRFPRGMKYLVQYVHQKGLKLGIYISMGLQTCKGYPGSKFYLKEDAELFAEWEIDMVKVDCCFSGSNIVEGYEAFGLFLNLTRRPIAYSCSFPMCVTQSASVYQIASKYCNSWRVFEDISDDWDRVYQIIQFYGKDEFNMSRTAGPGHWNDPDQLLVGDFSLSVGEQQSQFSMWAMFAAPLFMSNDVNNIPSESRDILLNRRVIAINQDPLGIQGHRVWTQPWTDQGLVEGWIKPLVKGSNALFILNGSPYGLPVLVKKSLQDFGLPRTEEYSLMDVVNGKNLGIYNSTSPIKLYIPARYSFLCLATPVTQRD